MNVLKHASIVPRCVGFFKVKTVAAGAEPLTTERGESFVWCVKWLAVLKPSYLPV